MADGSSPASSSGTLTPAPSPSPSLTGSLGQIADRSFLELDETSSQHSTEVPTKSEDERTLSKYLDNLRPALKLNTTSGETSEDQLTRTLRKFIKDIASLHSNPLLLLKNILKETEDKKYEEILNNVNNVVVDFKRKQSEAKKNAPVERARTNVSWNDEGRRSMDSVSTESSSVSLSRRYQTSFNEKIRDTLRKDLIDDKFFSGSQLLDIIGRSGDSVNESTLSLAQQLIDNQVIFPLDPETRTIRDDHLLLFSLEPLLTTPNTPKVNFLEYIGSPWNSLLFALFLEQAQIPHFSFWWKIESFKLKLLPNNSESFMSKLHARHILSTAPRSIRFQNIALIKLSENPKPTSEQLTWSLIETAQKEVYKIMESVYFPKYLSTLLFTSYSQPKENLSDLHYYYLNCKMMSDNGGITAKKMKIHGFSYSQCVSGSELVSWTVKNVCVKSRKEALEICQETIHGRDAPFFLVHPLLVDDDVSIYSFSSTVKNKKKKKSKDKEKKIKDKRSSSINSRLSDDSSAKKKEKEKEKEKEKAAEKDKKRKTLRKADSKHQIMKNFEEYEEEPLQMEKVVNNLTLGSTFTIRLSKQDVAKLEQQQSVGHSPSYPVQSLLESNSKRSSVDKMSVKSGESVNSEDAEKTRMKKAADIFNLNPKKAIDILVIEKQIPNKTPEDVANFLQKNTLLSKQKVGELLGEGEDFYIQTMHRFIEQLDFADLDFDIAIRIPGEAQKIDRILEKFANEYVKHNSTSVFNNADAAWAMAFAIIMLNTDAHNSQIKKKMTKIQFIHNCRGINDGDNFPEDYLGDVYDRIVLDEIKMMEDGALYPDAMKTGWMTMQVTRKGKLIQKWKRWWFILLPQSLLYFKKPGDSSPYGTIDMKTARIVKRSSGENKKFCFCIQTHQKQSTNNSPATPNANVNLRTVSKTSLKSETLLGESKMEIYELSLPSERELQSWTKVLGKAMDGLKNEEKNPNPKKKIKRMRSYSI